MITSPESLNVPRSALLARLRLLESVLENANDAVLITEAEPFDQPGPIIQYVNPAFTRMTGYSPEDALGKSPRFLQGPLSGKEGPSKIKQALQKWKSVEVELLNYRKDGTTFWVELSISPIADETGWFTHWISVQRDITERKANDEALARLHRTELQNHALTQQIEQRKAMEAELTHAAFHDVLTGLHNRIYFNEHLAHVLRRRPDVRSSNASVLFIDLDGFKGINDTLGHRAGDLFLIEIAHRLTACVRPEDTLARMGGDEFTLLLHDCSRKQALEVAQRVLVALAEPISLNGINLQASGSIGIREITPECRDAQEVMRDADIAMYQAKRQGGGRCIVFDSNMQEDAHNTLLLSKELQGALDRKEFQLFYQPIVEMRDGSMRGVEALIRWNHPTRGLLNPTEFVPLAEEVGLIVPIGRWVLEQATTDMKKLEIAGRASGAVFPDLFISVNVSTRQLDAESFLDDFFRLLRDRALDPRRLQLEITESSLIKDAARIGERLRAIRAAGIRVVFDDFGTGYCSMSYLERYPVDALKIDQWFIKDIDTDPKKAAVVHLIIKLAKIFDMGVSVEGVETQDQMAVLLQAGCTLAQGYLFDKPVSLADILDRVSGIA